jgi:hypothetical protein
MKRELLGFSIPVAFLILLLYIYFSIPIDYEMRICSDADQLLTLNLKGEKTLSESYRNDLLSIMNWCIDNGYVVKPLD